MPDQHPEIRLSKTDAAAPWGPDLKDKAGRALRHTQERLGLKLNGSVRLVSFGGAWEFENYVGERPESIFALARPARLEVIINRPAWFRASPLAREKVLVHEMTHLILGNRISGELPAWLNEGLAMVTARQHDFESAWRLNVAGTLGSLLPLEVLESQTAFRGQTQDLAYAQAFYLTRFYIQRALGDREVSPDDPKPLAQALADAETGPMLLRRLWDPNFQIALETQWRRSRGTLWTWLAFLSGASLLWAFISGLFLLAFWRKRRMARQIRERFAAEENMDAEFGTETPPWEYGAYDEGNEDEEDRNQRNR